MKSKIASILGLIFSFSIALMLTAFLGCGGGGDYGSGTQAYDGTWELTLWNFSLPPKAVGAPGEVSCSPITTTIVIAHGIGEKVATYIECINATEPIWQIDVSVVMTPDATGTTGTFKATTFGGIADGVCPTRTSCSTQGKGVTLFKL